jgi:hypothetical protein
VARERLYDYPETEYARAVKRLWGDNQLHAARMLGIDERTSRRYYSGDVPMKRPLQMLLRILVALKRTDEWIVEVTSKETPP